MGARKRREQEPEAAAAARGWANAAVWQLWPWLAWGLPVLLFFVVAAGGGGWEMLFAMIFSPVLLPVMALTNLVPRMVMRRAAGLRSSATPVSIAMIVHWWALALVALSHRGIGDSGSVDSWLGERFFGVREPLEATLFAIGLIAVLFSYTAALLFAVVAVSDLREAAAAGGEGSPQPAPCPDPWWARGAVWVVVSAVLVPVLVVGGIATGAAVGRHIAARVAAEQTETWERLQGRAGEVRGRISQGHWYLESARAGADRAGWEPGPDTYSVSFDWRLTSDAAVAELAERARAAAEAEGWSLAPIPVEIADEDVEVVSGSQLAYAATNSEGDRLELLVERRFAPVEPQPDGVDAPAEAETDAHTETRLVLRMESGQRPLPDDLWIDWRERTTPEERETEIAADGWIDGAPRGFAADEWPSLAHAQITMFS